MKESQDFKVGDIVYHKKGYIGSGKYGEIILDYDGELTVLDNEYALDMPVEGNEDNLIVVGNVSRNRDMLEVNSEDNKGK